MNGAREIRIIKAKNVVDKKLRVAAYCRVSSDSTDQVNSFYAQVRYYNDYIRANEDMILVDIYADEGISGTSINKREDFKRLIKDCGNKKIDRVLVKSITRFARNSLECFETIRKLKSYGTSVFFENDNIDTEKMNSEMILYIKGAFAQNEAISASKRMRTSIRMKMQDGTYTNSHAPYGYKYENGELVIVESEAKIVREIFRLFLSGVGATGIYKRLYEQGNSAILDHKAIRYILSNEKYIGDTLYQKFYTTDLLPLKIKPNRGELPKYYCQNTHEPIISKEDFYRVQEIMKVKAEKWKTKNTRAPEIYTKILRCRHCNCSYKKAKRASGEFWICRKKGSTIDLCPSRNLTTQELNRAFINMFNTLKQNEKIIIDEALSQYNALRIQISRGNSTVADIDKEIASLAQRKIAYNNLFASNVLDEVTFFEQTSKIDGRLSELRDSRAKLLKEDDEVSCIDKLRELKRIVSDKPYLTDMDEDLFKRITDQIYVEEDGTLTFCLKSELQLRVRP